MDQTINNPIYQIIRNRGHGRLQGLYSCCSANPLVLRAAMRRAKKYDCVLLVESTANQVNQYGGYTGMTPDTFLLFLMQIAREEKFPAENLFCGGDHLGPLTWQHLPEREAMQNAKELIRAYVLAGFTKIHIDTSMRVLDDDANIRLPDVVIARRGAELCLAAEEAYQERRMNAEGRCIAPVYVIGSEVPIPGGAKEEEDSVEVTRREDCLQTLSHFREAFARLGLTDTWDRVIAIVVQPGVEFTNRAVFPYSRRAASELLAALPDMDGIVFEGHSTDYQNPQRLREMVEDGIAVLKVGPALTFGLREGLFSLECIEKELQPQYCFTASNFRNNLEKVMLDSPGAWERYCTGTAAQKAFDREFGYSDRIRYYLPDEDIEKTIEVLFDNLNSHKIPDTLLRQYMPIQYAKVSNGDLLPYAEDLVLDCIGNVIDTYYYATLR